MSYYTLAICCCILLCVYVSCNSFPEYVQKRPRVHVIVLGFTWRPLSKIALASPWFHHFWWIGGYDRRPWCRGKAYSRATRETQFSPSVLTLRISVMCRVHASFRGMLTRELPTRTLLSSIAWVFTLSFSITQPLQLNPTINIGYKRLYKITIKFGMEWKPTKHIIVNYNFTTFIVHCGWIWPRVVLSAYCAYLLLFRILIS